MIAGLGQLLGASAYTREVEREADAMAAQLMNGGQGNSIWRWGT